MTVQINHNFYAIISSDGDIIANGNFGDWCREVVEGLYEQCGDYDQARRLTVMLHHNAEIMEYLICKMEGDSNIAVRQSHLRGITVPLRIIL